MDLLKTQDSDGTALVQPVPIVAVLPPPPAHAEQQSKRGRKPGSRNKRTRCVFIPDDLGRDTWQSDLLNLYADGASNAEAKKWIWERLGRPPQSIWDYFIENFPAFADTVKLGNELSEAWWTRLGKTHLTSRELNDRVWLATMKNRFGWREKVENDVGERTQSNLGKLLAELDGASRGLPALPSGVTSKR